MPDYHTRLRTSSQIVLPRRLRPSPSPPPRHRRPVPQPHFPPPDVVLHPDDAANKTLLAIARALLAVHNRALTIKDLSHLTLDYGLLCQTCVHSSSSQCSSCSPLRSPSAASQAITTFIRNHLTRVHHDRVPPLLLSLPLTGTAADDELAPALHSRSGGTSTVKDPTRSLTSFRRGTTVWYLSEAAGAQCPFRTAGLDIDHILNPAKGTKRKREPHRGHGPAMATRHRPQPDQPPSARLRVKLTVKPREPTPSSSEPPSSTDDELSDVESLFPVPDHPLPDAASDFSQSGSSSSHQLPPYPILSPSIPSPSCSTPTTVLASPSALSDPLAPYRSALSIKYSFTSFRTALSNPPPDHRARSSSLPFSAASPPPDSEDEDEDYHNSMVGLRRGSVPLKEEQQEPLDPIIFTSTPCTIPWGLPPLKQEHPHEGLSTPLEVLPGYLSYSPQSDHVPVKDEPMSAVLPPDAVPYAWHHDTVKPEPVWEDEQPHLQSDAAGTKEDPVHIEVHDVEVLGP
jgi:hypothetical protein